MNICTQSLVNTKRYNKIASLPWINTRSKQTTHSSLEMAVMTQHLCNCTPFHPYLRLLLLWQSDQSNIGHNNSKHWMLSILYSSMEMENCEYHHFFSIHSQFPLWTIASFSLSWKLETLYDMQLFSLFLRIKKWKHCTSGFMIVSWQTVKLQLSLMFLFSHYPVDFLWNV